MITTCLLFVRTVLCKSCNIRIIRGMHAAERANGGDGGGDRRMEKTAAGSKVRVDIRVFSREGANVRSE